MQKQQKSLEQSSHENDSLIVWSFCVSKWTLIQKLVMFSLILTGLSILIAYPVKGHGGNGGIIADGLAVAGLGCFVAAVMILTYRKITGKS